MLGGYLLRFQSIDQAVQVGFREIDLSFARLLVLAGRIELQHKDQTLRRTLYYYLLALSGGLTSIEEVHAHIKAS